LPQGNLFHIKEPAYTLWHYQIKLKLLLQLKKKQFFLLTEKKIKSGRIPLKGGGWDTMLKLDSRLPLLPLPRPRQSRDFASDF